MFDIYFHQDQDDSQATCNLTKMGKCQGILRQEVKAQTKEDVVGG